VNAFFAETSKKNKRNLMNYKEVAINLLSKLEKYD